MSKGQKMMLMWGAGNVCRHFLQHLKKNLPVQGIVDSRRELSSGTICGIPIYAPVRDDAAKELKIRHDEGRTFAPSRKTRCSS